MRSSKLALEKLGEGACKDMEKLHARTKMHGKPPAVVAFILM